MRQDPRFPNLFIVDHPLVQHKLSHVRDAGTSTRTFRELLREITLLLGYEVTRDLPLTTRRIQTPLTAMDAPVIAGKKLAVVPVLRAGLGMADGLLDLVPSARVGQIGVYRNADKRPVEYYVRLPEIDDRSFIVCDPMVGTGHSAAHAVSVLKGRGVPAERIRFVALVASPEGVAEYQRQHPDVPMVRRARRPPRRARVHRARAGRRGGPVVRNEMTVAEACPAPDRSDTDRGRGTECR